MKRRLQSWQAWQRGWAVACAAGLGALACVAAGVALLAAPPASARVAAPCPPPLPPATAREPARDRGLLWRITRDGHSSWLFGTLHVGKPAWSRLGPRVAAALQASDVLALELDPGDPALLRELAEPGPPLVLPAALQLRLDQAYQRACIAPATLAAMHPLLQATTLTVLEARWLGLDAAYAQEHLLLARSRGDGRVPPRRLLALETAAQQKAALLSSDPAEALNTLADSLAQLEDASGRRVLARMASAWERGDLHTLSTYETWCACATGDEERAAMRRLNDERNPALADGIEAQHRAGLRVFAAVGALHMTGSAGLPLLLARRGFRVERIAFAP